MAISDAQFAAWLLQDNANRCVLVELDYQYEILTSTGSGTPATETLYFSDKVYFSGTHPYVDAVATVPEYSRSLGGNQLGTYSSSLGTLELANPDGRLDLLLDLAVDGSEIRFYLGDVSWARSDFRMIFTALSLKATAPSIDRISVALKDTGLLLNQSIGGTTKVGGTGPNADQYRPVNFGLVRQIPCLVQDPFNLVYVHSDTGAGLSAGYGLSYTETIRDRGQPVVFTDNSDGTVTLAASPAGQITADVLYNYASRQDNFCVSDAMQFFVGDRCGLSALGLYFGPGPTYSTHPISAIGTWLLAGGEDYQIGIDLPDARNMVDLLGDLTASGQCFWAIRRDGKFTFGRLRPSYTAVLGLTAAHTIVEDTFDNGSFQMDHLEPGYFALQAYMNKNWSIQTDLASGLTPDQRAKLTRPGLTLLQDDPTAADYADAPQLYNKTLTRSPLIETLLSSYDDTIATTLLRLWMQVRLSTWLPWTAVVSLTVGIEFYDVELGDLVTLKMPRFGFDAGVDFQVISIGLKLPNKVDLKLIRRDIQGPYQDVPIVPGSNFLLKLNPIVTGPNAQYLATTLLLHFDGVNGGTVFTDSSPNGFTMVSS